jgi:hypothetical protein
LVQKEKIDWICVCGKRLGLEDSMMQNWSLYWPAFHISPGLFSLYHKAPHVLCAGWSLRIDLILLPWWSLYYWDGCIYNLQLYYNWNVTWIQLTEQKDMFTVKLISY